MLRHHLHCFNEDDGFGFGSDSGRSCMDLVLNLNKLWEFDKVDMYFKITGGILKITSEFVDYSVSLSVTLLRLN